MDAVNAFLAEQYAVANAVDEEFGRMRFFHEWLFFCFELNWYFLTTNSSISYDPNSRTVFGSDEGSRELWQDTNEGGDSGDDDPRTGDDTDNKISKNGLTENIFTNVNEFVSNIFNRFFGFSNSDKKQIESQIEGGNIAAKAGENIQEVLTSLFLPDFFGLSIGFSGVVGVGAGTSFDITWMKGNCSPIFTLTQSIGFGMNISPFYFSVNRFEYFGSDNLNYKLLETSIANDNFGVYGSLGKGHF